MAILCRYALESMIYCIPNDALDAVIVVEFDKSLADVQTIRTSFENIDKGDPKTLDLK